MESRCIMLHRNCRWRYTLNTVSWHLLMLQLRARSSAMLIKHLPNPIFWYSLLTMMENLLRSKRESKHVKNAGKIIRIDQELEEKEASNSILEMLYKTYVLSLWWWIIKKREALLRRSATTWEKNKNPTFLLFVPLPCTLLVEQMHIGVC